jgi:hypothetical protein
MSLMDEEGGWRMENEKEPACRLFCNYLGQVEALSRFIDSNLNGLVCDNFGIIENFVV